MPYKNKEDERRNKKEYNLRNREKRRKYMKERYFIPEVREKTRQASKTKIERIKSDPEAHKVYLEYHRNQRKVNKEAKKAVQWEYTKARLENDPIFKAVRLSRTRLGQLLKKMGLKKKVKVGKFENRYGCTPDKFKAYIEAQFSEGMTWENRGKVWQLDHFIPVSAIKMMDLSYAEQYLSMLEHYTNLRPLFKYENLVKSDTLPDKMPDNFPYWSHFLHIFEGNQTC